MIISKLGVVMADRGISVNELADKVGIAPTNLTRMRTGKIKGVRFSSLDAICDVLDCQPGDIFIFKRKQGAIINEGESIMGDNGRIELMDA